MSTGTVTLVVNAVGRDGTFLFSSSPSGLSMSLTTTGGDATHTGTASSGQITLPAGTYLVTENAIYSGFDLPSTTCVDPDNGTQVLFNHTVSIDLDAGENITCTFTNTAPGDTIYPGTVDSQVNTSIGYGTFTPPPGYGSATPVVRTEQNLSGPLAIVVGGGTDSSVTPSGPWPFPKSGDFPSLLGAFGTLSNRDFLTLNRADRGNAGQQMFDAMDQMVADFEAAHPGLNVHVQKSANTIAGAHTGFQFFSMFGGLFGGSGDILTVLTGQPDIDFYEVDYTLSATVATGVTLVVKTEGGDGTFTFTSPTSALGVSVTTSGGMGSTGAIPLAAGSYAVTAATGNGFALTDLSCTDPNGNSSTDLSSRTATIDLQANEGVVCTFTMTNSKTRTTALIHNFIRHRLDALLSEDPEGTRWIRRFPGSLWGGGNSGGAPLAFSGSLTADRLGDMPVGDVTFSTGLDQIAGAMAYADEAAAGKMGTGAGPPLPAAGMPGGLDVWTEGHYRGYRNDAGGSGDEGYLGIFYLGADVPITDNILLGGLTEFDWAWEHSGSLGSTTQGSGWSAGPYVSARLGKNLFLDLRAAWGASSNAISPFGTYTDSFSTSRWLTTARLTGNWSWGKWRLTPSAALKYGSETQAAYTDSVGTSIPLQTVSISRFAFGPEVAYRMKGRNGALIEPQVQLTGVWNFAGTAGDIDPLTGASASTAALTASLVAALAVTEPTGASYRLAAGYAGIGSSDDAVSLALHVTVPIH